MVRQHGDQCAADQLAVNAPQGVQRDACAGKRRDPEALVPSSITGRASRALAAGAMPSSRPPELMLSLSAASTNNLKLTGSMGSSTKAEF